MRGATGSRTILSLGWARRRDEGASSPARLIEAVLALFSMDTGTRAVCALTSSRDGSNHCVAFGLPNSSGSVSLKRAAHLLNDDCAILLSLRHSLLVRPLAGHCSTLVRQRPRPAAEPNENASSHSVRAEFVGGCWILEDAMILPLALVHVKLGWHARYRICLSSY